MRKFIAPVFTPVAAVVLSLATPGVAQASVYEGQSHSAVAVSATVRSGDTAWGIAARLCGRGGLHSSLLIRSPQGVTRYNHDRIWPKDLVTGRCGVARQSAPTVSAPPSSGWVSPLRSYRLSSCFAWRAAIYRDGRLISRAGLHLGLDMSAPGGTPIRAAAAGVVLEVNAHWGYGISVTLSHGGNVRSFYGHMSSRAVVVGQRVGAGQTIGRVGSTGASTGNHLHFGMHYGPGSGYRDSNPAPWLRSHGVRVGC